MAKIYGPIGGQAECQNCPWRSASYKNLQAIAASHAKKTGHTVRGEISMMFEY